MTSIWNLSLSCDFEPEYIFWLDLYPNLVYFWHSRAFILHEIIRFRPLLHMANLSQLVSFDVSYTE